MIPNKIRNPQSNIIFANEADVTQLVCLANLETLNAEFIYQGLSQRKRLIRLNQIAIIQMKSLTANKLTKKFK